MGEVIEFPTKDADPDVQALDNARAVWILAHVPAGMAEEIRDTWLALAWQQRHTFDCYLLREPA
jgi:hypothetical protein